MYFAESNKLRKFRTWGAVHFKQDNRDKIIFQSMKNAFIVMWYIGWKVDKKQYDRR